MFPSHDLARMTTRSWEHEGKKFYRSEIVGDQMIMLNAKPKQKSEPSDGLGPDPSEDLGNISVEDLPF